MRALRMMLCGIITLGLLSHVGNSSAMPPTAGAPGAASCQWRFSANGVGSYQPLYADPDNTAIGNLRFGEGYAQLKPDIARDGYLDFDGDNRSDVFRAILRDDGLLQWQFSPGGVGAWQNLAYDGTPLADLRFGDFDGDGKTDVFSVTPRPDGFLQWRYSSGGVGAWQNLAYDGTPLADLRFGDFDGDGKTDVFSVAPRPDGLLQWRYSSGGASLWQSMAYDGTPLSDLRFGDFDGDGKTDVFSVTPRPDGFLQWRYSSGGVGAWQNLAYDGTPLADLRYGDFDGDGKTDVFSVTPRPDGLLQWRYSTGGVGAWHSIAYDSAPLAALRFGYFDTDNATDVFAATCGLQISRRGFPQPFADRVLGQELLTTSQAGTTDRAMHGPAALAIAPNGRLFVADYKNNRVLSWPDALTFHSGDAADLVIGQPDFTSGDDNRGNGTIPSANSLWGPESVAVDKNGRLFVADTSNHRVLIFDGPFTPGVDPSASVVLGQPNATTPGTGFGDCATPVNANFCYPRGMALDSGGRLYVADEFNSRVLVFAPPFSPAGQLATKVIGQPDLDFTSKIANWTGPTGAPPTTPNAYGLWEPRGLAIDAADRLFVADSQNNRVVMFPTPLAKDAAASLAIGQPDLTSGSANQGKMNASVYSLSFPIDLAIDTLGNLYVSDLNNHRVLEYDMGANFDLAADHMFGYTPNYGICGSDPDPDPMPTQISLRCPLGLAVNPFGGLLIADFYNNRVLAYDVPIQHGFIPLIQR